jgi:hypothetical protein
MTNWKSIDKAQKGIGSLLLRDFGGLADSTYVGHQDADSGRWFAEADIRTEVHPTRFCPIPEFDADEAAS